MRSTPRLPLTFTHDLSYLERDWARENYFNVITHETITLDYFSLQIEDLGNLRQLEIYQGLFDEPERPRSTTRGTIPWPEY